MSNSPTSPYALRRRRREAITQSGIMSGMRRHSYGANAHSLHGHCARSCVCNVRVQTHTQHNTFPDTSIKQVGAPK